MSMEEMDIDSSPPSAQPIAESPSLEKKRKHKEKDHKSSKRRRHEEGLEVEEIADDGDLSLKKGKKKKKHEREDRHRSQTPQTPDPSSQLQQDLHAERSSQKKHRKRKAAEDYSTPPSTQPRPRAGTEDSRPSPQGQSPTLSRAPLANATATHSSKDSFASSPFHLITSTLYLPLSPVSISPTLALPSLLSEHVSPLLLTYYPPLQGIIFAYSNPSISSSPPSATSTSSKPKDSNPTPLTLATTANEYGVLYVYLTATFLVFRPEHGQILEACINVQSEGFMGGLAFNIFSVGIERSRLPADWKWIPPGENEDQMDTSSESGYPTTANTTDAEDESDSDGETHFRPLPPAASVNFDDPSAIPAVPDDGSDGYFQTPSGKRVCGVMRFRVKDIDVIPGSERDKGFLTIQGTMLNEEEEAKLQEEEKRRFGGPKSKTARGNSQPTNGESSMSGALTPNRS